MTKTTETRQATPPSAFNRFIFNNRAMIGTLAVFLIMMAIFVVASPRVFLNWQIYNSILVTLPVALFVVVPLVFVVTVGEIDLSFPATMGFASWIFALLVNGGIDPLISLIAACIVGMGLGFGVGALVVYGSLSSLIATLGMNYMLRGLILIITQGKSIALPNVRDTWLFPFLTGDLSSFPTQIVWGVLFVIVSALIYNRHRFGARIKAVGDNPDSAAQMGISVKRIRLGAFVYMGLGAALAGIFSVLINFTWWPSTGDGYLLPGLASVFVGGTPTWGGIGTIFGSAIGALIVSFIQSGIIAAGLTGFYVQFFNGLIIILALLGHRWNQTRYR
jgi:ribose/xylose/arabinose/galactoside ABC-type transport system permease subunit